MRMFTPQLLILWLKMLVQLDQYTQYSPFLSACGSFNRSNIVEINAAEHLIQNYLAFLRGEDFTFDEEDVNFFDYMGHPNINGYPLDYWKLKLKQDWIRDNFHRLALYKDPLYGLIKVPIVAQIKIELELDPSHTMIAGEAALFMTGVIKSIHPGINLFSVNKDKSLDMLKNKIRNIRGDSLGSPTLHVEIQRGLPFFRITSRSRIALVTKCYTSPSEIAHSFDTDCLQFILVGDELYGTELALHCIKHKYQYPDPRYFTPSYIKRLNRYHRDGIYLKMPLLTEDDLDLGETFRYLMALYRCDWEYLEDKDAYVDSSDISILCYISLHDICSPRAIHTLTERYISLDHRNFKQMFLTLEGSYNTDPSSQHPVLSEWDGVWDDVISNVSKSSKGLIELYKECPILSQSFKESLP
jgi:hypothetical protein